MPETRRGRRRARAKACLRIRSYRTRRPRENADCMDQLNSWKLTLATYSSTVCCNHSASNRSPAKQRVTNKCAHVFESNDSEAPSLIATRPTAIGSIPMTSSLSSGWSSSLGTDAEKSIRRAASPSEAVTPECRYRRNRLSLRPRR